MRLKSVIWAKAYIRRCSVAGASAFVVRHGDDDAGAIYIKVTQQGGGRATLYGPAPGGLDSELGDRHWSLHLDPAEDAEPTIDAYLARQYAFDRDIWVIEVEDREGRHFLDDLRPAH